MIFECKGKQGKYKILLREDQYYLYKWDAGWTLVQFIMDEKQSILTAARMATDSAYAMATDSQ